jgi:hypothetical protein
MTTEDNGKNFVGQVLADTYRIERLLGEGGMGAVYEASHARLPRRFAVKVLFSQVAVHEDVLQRFQREAQITSEIGHPNIVEVVDFNHADGVPYLVMELLDGQDLDQLIATDAPLPIERCKDIALQIAAALRAAHNHQVIHRDLKPSNVFICPREEGAVQVKVVDFGISKVLGAGTKLTGTRVTMGTPGYMAPEQAQGKSAHVNEQTDVFALGVILYEMLTGRQPFSGDTIPSVLYNIVYEPHRPLLELRPDVPAYMVDALDIALAKKPEDRFANMSAFAAALKGELLSVSAMPVGQDEEQQLSYRPTDKQIAVPRAAVAMDTARVPGRVAETTLGSTAGEVALAPPTQQITASSRRGVMWIVAVAALLLVGAGAGVVLMLGGSDKEDRNAVAGVALPPPIETPPVTEPKKVPEKTAPKEPPKKTQVVISVTAAKRLRRVRCFLHVKGKNSQFSKAPCRFAIAVGAEATLEIKRYGFRLKKS